MSIINFKYKDINFVESGAIVSLDKEKEVLNFLSPNIHIIGFNDAKDTIVAICLEFGLAADGKNKREAMNKVLSLTEEFLLKNKKNTIETILKSSNMDQYWSLYRLYEKRNAPKKIKINKKAIEKRNNVETEQLIDNFKKLQHKLDQTENFIEYLILENNKLRSNNNESKNSAPLLIPTGANMHWAIEG